MSVYVGVSVGVPVAFAVSVSVTFRVAVSFIDGVTSDSTTIGVEYADGEARREVHRVPTVGEEPLDGWLRYLSGSQFPALPRGLGGV